MTWWTLSYLMLSVNTFLEHYWQMARVRLKSVCQRWPGIGMSESVQGDKGQSLLFSGQTIMPKGLS